MADHNESPSTTENTCSHEFINTTDAGEEFLNPGPPAYSVDDHNRGENNTKNWMATELEQERFADNSTTQFEYEEDSVASPGRFKGSHKTYNDAQHDAGQTNRFAGHHSINSYQQLRAARSGRPYPGQTHPAQPNPVKPYPANSHPAKTHQTKPSQSVNLKVQRLSDASRSPCIGQVLTVTRAGQLVPAETLVTIERGALAQTQQKVNCHFATSVFVAMCCCLPIGILAVRYSSKARAFVSIGRYREARKYSRKSMDMNVGGIVLGILFGTLLSVYYYLFLRRFVIYRE